MKAKIPSSIKLFLFIGKYFYLRTRVPFMHFFDGNRVSAEISKIDKINFEDMKQLLPKELLQANMR